MPVSGPEGAKDLHNLRWGRASAGGWTLVLSASVPDIRGGGLLGPPQEHRSTGWECWEQGATPMLDDLHIQDRTSLLLLHAQYFVS